MAVIKRIALPDGSVYDLKAAGGQGPELIRGTQTESTNNWTGETVESDLYDGMRILYLLPFVGTSSAATLTLTLSDGTTTAAKPVYRYGTTRAKNEYTNNTILAMTYLSDADAWYIDGDYNTNTHLFYRVGKCYGNYEPSTNLYRYMVLLSINESQLVPINALNNNVTTTKTLTTETFDPFGPIYYYASTTIVSANGLIGGSRLYQQYEAVDLRYSFNTGTSLIPDKAVYLVAVPQSGGGAKLASTPISQTIPNIYNGLIYIYLGQARSTSQIEMTVPHSVYWFYGGKIRPYTGEYTLTIDFGTVSSLPVTKNFNGVTADMIPVSWQFGSRKAFGRFLTVTTSDNGNVTLSGSMSGFGTSTVKITLSNSQEVVETT